MAFGKKNKRKQVDERLLQEIYLLKDEWMRLREIIEKSVEPSVTGLYDLKVAEIKYFYLLREARSRGISAKHR
ncbi:hypothetical protein GCM10011351_31300 [Paraliobacillus quinghaiensis]|uniref:DUF2508 family protein n=1 Tax=Paraliobacillus quinghaiensis TaxID=470815 RepID=A0A917TZI1_9BACI|nr:YaaL family protein [Paraliobacillus quinghaiensis]GGM43090.1 hypothetical protein GCM10011351_31300 [Paraliobacillus quinghaiensis]